MTQEPKRPINLSVHETSDPSLISPNPDKDASGELNDLNDSVHDDENVDVPHPGPVDTASDEKPVPSQISIVNSTAG